MNGLKFLSLWGLIAVGMMLNTIIIYKSSIPTEWLLWDVVVSLIISCVYSLIDYCN